MTPRELIIDAIERHTKAMDLRQDVVICIMLQESKGDTFAWRWEEKFWEQRLKNKDRSQLSGWTPKPGTLPSITDELLQRSCSFGLMQVLGDTARWCAKVTSPYLTSLCDPDRGIEAGCRILSFYLKQASGDYRGALKGYNGSWSYADEVLGRVQRREHVAWMRGEV